MIIHTQCRTNIFTFKILYGNQMVMSYLADVGIANPILAKIQTIYSSFHIQIRTVWSSILVYFCI